MNNSYTKYECAICGVDFGNKKSNLEKHMMTRKHKLKCQQNAKNKQAIEKMKDIDKGEAMVEILKLLQGNIKPEPMTDNITVKDILKRENSKIRLPKRTFDKYFSLGRIMTFCDFENIYKDSNDIIYDGIVSMIEQTKPEDLPVILSNRDVGTRGKTYYYESGAKFEYQSCSKMHERKLFIRFKSLLRNSIRNMFKGYLDEIWNGMPDDLKDYFVNEKQDKQKRYDPKSGRTLTLDGVFWDNLVCVDDFGENKKGENEESGCMIPGCMCWNCYETGDDLRTQINLYNKKTFINHNDELIHFDNEEKLTNVVEELCDYIQNNKNFKTFMRFKRMENAQNRRIWDEKADPLVFFNQVQAQAKKLINEISDIIVLDNVYQEILDAIDE